MMLCAGSLLNVQSVLLSKQITLHILVKTSLLSHLGHWPLIDSLLSLHNPIQ